MFNIDFLNELRLAELELISPRFTSGSRILEFGAGTGAQALRLESLGLDVTALDISTSGYSHARVFPILEYNGVDIPLPDSSIDVIYSSNVLEHVEDLEKIFSEFKRILRSDGHCIHVMPSVAWRIWTLLTGYIVAFHILFMMIKELIKPGVGSRFLCFRKNLKKFAGAFLPIGHGTSWEGISEIWTFSVPAWRSNFKKYGFNVIEAIPLGLFHTGHMMLGSKLKVSHRKRISSWLGSAATVYVVKVA